MIQEITMALAAVGLIFQFLGAVALHRFFDPYTRLHGSTKCTTFGSIFIALAVMLYGYSLGSAAMVLHTLAALAFVMLTNPTGAHAIARAAYRHGVMPKRAVVDKLKGARK